MAVLKVFQGKGFGAKLVKEAENHCVNLNADLIWFNARENAVPFYEKCGYKIEGEIFIMHLHFFLFFLLQ